MCCVCALSDKKYFSAVNQIFAKHIFVLVSCAWSHIFARYNESDGNKSVQFGDWTSAWMSCSRENV